MWIYIFLIFACPIALTQMIGPKCTTLKNECLILMDGGQPSYSKYQFSEFCNKHRVCYTCAYKLNLNKDSCDRTLFQEMRRRCWRNKPCKRYVNRYYEVLRKTGNTIYDTIPMPSEGFCDGPNIIPCLKYYS